LVLVDSDPWPHLNQLMPYLPLARAEIMPCIDTHSIIVEIESEILSAGGGELPETTRSTDISAEESVDGSQYLGGAATTDNPPTSNEIVKIKSEFEIPAEFREGGRQTGAPLTAGYVGQPETYGLSKFYLSKNYKGKRLSWQRRFIYEFQEIAALSNRLHAKK
jgi:hypothetical protein